MNLPENSPLVSIIVITYNSGKYVLETLESAKAQTYRNIELIVSDDGSTDNTVEICRKWIEENKDSFVRTELITVDKNTGIPANCNRGVKAAQGEWVKLIAGDDVLSEDCLSENISFALKDSNRKIIISDIIRFKNSTELSIVGQHNIVKPKHLDLLQFNPSPKDQYIALLRNYFGNTPSLFISKSVFEDIKFDEKLKFIEDYPFALNATKKGIPFYYLNEALVFYRISNSSIYAGKKKYLLFNDFYKKKYEFDLKYRFPYLSWVEKGEEKFEYYWKLIMDKFNLNKNHPLFSWILSLSFYVNPFRILKKYQMKRNK